MTTFCTDVHQEKPEKPCETVSGTQYETQQREDETLAQRSSLHWSHSNRQRTQT